MKHPIIDWDLGNKIAGNNMNHAKEFIILLTDDLSKQLDNVRIYVQNNNYDELKKYLHQLLGALSYCGAIRLKMAAELFYQQVKDQINIIDAWKNFESEAILLIKEAKKC